MARPSTCDYNSPGSVWWRTKWRCTAWWGKSSADAQRAARNTTSGKLDPATRQGRLFPQPVGRLRGRHPQAGQGL